LVAQFQYNKSDDTYTCPQGEILKTTGRWHKKAVELSKAVISSKIPNTRLQNCPVNHLCTSRTAGREIDRSEYAQGVEENNKRYQKTRNYTERDKR
jgi:hypothetical protein